MPSIPKYFNERGGTNNKVLRLLQFRSHVDRTLVALSPDVVQCANEEYAFMALRLRERRRCSFSVVCDIFDSLGLRFGHATFPVGALARTLTDYVHRNADHLLVTDERRLERLGHHRGRASIVANYPVDPGPDLALSDVRGTQKRLFVGGALSAARGLETLIELVDNRRDITAVSAGWVYDDVARRFVEHDRVEYHGVLEPAEALALAATCNVIIALYKPDSENNILASPNKVYDALCIGRPVIINSETAISEWIGRIGAGFLVSYGRLDELESAIQGLPTDAKERQQEAKRLRAIFEEGYSWDIAERSLLRVYDHLAKRHHGRGREATSI